MRLRYTANTLQENIDSVMAFQQDGESAFWLEPLYHFFPSIDKARVLALPTSERRAYIGERLAEVYADNEKQLAQKVAAYQARWDEYQPQITDAMSDAFSLDCKPIRNDMLGKVSLDPISPRWLDTRSFEVFYLNSERGALGLSLHEIIHFVWFAVWQHRYHDDASAYERPHLKWILSEMVIEPIMSDPRLSGLNPYYPREQGGCVYRYFFDMIVGGRSVLDTLAEMYRARADIGAFMDESYAYCLAHEREIRAHIERAEQTW